MIVPILIGLVAVAILVTPAIIIDACIRKEAEQIRLRRAFKSHTETTRRIFQLRKWNRK